ncbi:MAG: hypothetical protein QHH07_08905 [Sedimentisphaerales bacterium]|nr:hypothetical protein [Sedimentisphaerales bacterium]
MEGLMLGLVVSCAVATVNGRLTARQAGYIRGWLLSDVAWQRLGWIRLWRFERALRHFIRAVMACDWATIDRLFLESAGSYPIQIRCQVLELCIAVAAAGSVGPEVFQRLKAICSRLMLGASVLSEFIAKHLPLEALDQADPWIILGIDEDMGKDQVRQELNRQYASWNARACSIDPVTRMRAAKMVDIIAQLRVGCGG